MGNNVAHTAYYMDWKQEEWRLNGLKEWHRTGNQKIQIIVVFLPLTVIAYPHEELTMWQACFSSFIN